MKPTQLCVALLLTVFLSACNRPRPTGIEFEKIDAAAGPDQHLVTGDEPIIVAVKNSTFALTPKAKYRLSGTVVSRESYSDGWDSILSPVDLAIAWGKLADPQFEKHVSFSQSGRWYYYKAHAGSPVDNRYIGTHSGNNHIIPANQNVSKAVKWVRRKDKIILEGFLVDVKGTYKGGTVMWNTSLSRTDTGNGSCELFYVTKTRIDTKVYE